MKIEFREGHIYWKKGKPFNPSGYYLLRSFLGLFWYRVYGPYRHIQQAEKKLKDVQG